MTTIAVIQAGLRTPSTTALLAAELSQAVDEAFVGAAPQVNTGSQVNTGGQVNTGSQGNAGSQVTIEVIEVRQHAHAIVDHLLTGFPSPALAADLDRVAGADGLVLVTPVFSASYSGLFKSFIDVIEPDALANKPVLLAATGGSERHSLMIEHALRPLVTYLGADPVRTGVYAATADFGDRAGSALSERSRRAAAELAARVLAPSAGLVPTREPDRDGQLGRDPQPSPAAMPGFVPFDELLARVKP